MSLRLYLAALTIHDPRIQADDTGVRILLDDRENWLTLENRSDCAALMQLAADADSVFIRQEAGMHYADPYESGEELIEEPLPPLPQRDKPVRTTIAAIHVTGAADQAQADAEAALARWAHKTGSEPRDDDEEQVSP